MLFETFPYIKQRILDKVSTGTPFPKKALRNHCYKPHTLRDYTHLSSQPCSDILQLLVIQHTGIPVSLFFTTRFYSSSYQHGEQAFFYIRKKERNSHRTLHCTKNSSSESTRTGKCLSARETLPYFERACQKSLNSESLVSHTTLHREQEHRDETNRVKPWSGNVPVPVSKRRRSSSCIGQNTFSLCQMDDHSPTMGTNYVTVLSITNPFSD